MYFETVIRERCHGAAYIFQRHKMTENKSKLRAEAAQPVKPAMAEGNPVFRMMGMETNLTTYGC